MQIVAVRRLAYRLPLLDTIPTDVAPNINIRLEPQPDHSKAICVLVRHDVV